MRPTLSDVERPRQPQIEKRLRRQPARAARLDQNALLTVLRQRDHRRRRPRLAAGDLQIGSEHQAGPRHVDAAHGPEHVRAIVRKPAAGVGEIVGIASERNGSAGERSGRGANGADLGTGSGRPAVRLQSIGPRESVGAKACQPLDRRFSTTVTRPL